MSQKNSVRQCLFRENNMCPQRPIRLDKTNPKDSSSTSWKFRKQLYTQKSISLTVKYIPVDNKIHWHFMFILLWYTWRYALQQTSLPSTGLSSSTDVSLFMKTKNHPMSGFFVFRFTGRSLLYHALEDMTINRMYIAFKIPPNVKSCQWAWVDKRRGIPNNRTDTRLCIIALPVLFIY